MARLAIGDSAPDISVLDVEGNPILLSGIWDKGAVLISFLRHFG